MNDELKQSLETVIATGNTLSYLELQGFLFAVACSPESVSAEQWLEVVAINADDPLTQAYMALHDSISQQIKDRNISLPAECFLVANPNDNVGEQSPLGQWSRGFVQGHQWLINLWNAHLPDELRDDLASSVMVLSSFSSPRIAESFTQQIKSKATTVEDFAAHMLDLLENAMKRYALMGHSMNQASLEVDKDANA